VVCAGVAPNAWAAAKTIATELLKRPHGDEAGDRQTTDVVIRKVAAARVQGQAATSSQSMA
jgi:urease accessory protein UreH